MKKLNIIIVDYGMGNLHSVKKKLLRIKTNPVISSDPAEILKADKLILPGVGHFLKAMQNIKMLNLLDTLNEAVLAKKTPILGICLGMQLMAKSSEEGNAEGFGWFDAEVIRFNIENTLKYKVPHTGWNQIMKKNESFLMKDIAANAEFYFVHSYHFKTNVPTDILNETAYEHCFVSAVEKENIFGVQYHPEKSHDEGERLLRNFVEI
ncbi:MAG: imidazole glycerol phosphate synthase, glutamine amidotransferase subunit [Bacteroidetes bacterium RIFOXYA12_FULL_35_11]|nr:MAG: imidazole glycerol phosphate synthase, glutamine amidotransferase subunit [Bacteroidetes bacterium GWF2_35_48]OFY80050.1 MAG: imidazole glycerol phosphate synthase, glutamine amidotransferase subunit [Bacteroidetes bacterium RIFOXYA12_FULL_35_11]OFY95571.1 MAG: imidazole glycerol phosphate synthase, glutamine amidotransferase subunit [Bacteroidetes bacterium RIFOXYB2_FULL_35_7]OFZ06560.1 MAG: imidazole glycerol phosphate synthase, glutamine amidotransferase subunit [Bacteroidetes bacteri